jgi:hypothetical protein
MDATGAGSKKFDALAIRTSLVDDEGYPVIEVYTIEGVPFQMTCG